MPVEALFNAVRRGDVADARQAIDALLAEGPQRALELRLGRWADENGNTLACLAAAAGHASLIDLFSGVGMDLTVPNRSGNAPIHLGALRCQAAVIRSLHRAGLDLAQENTHHQAPSHIAACHGWVPVINELLAAGVDLRVRSSQEGWAPLDIAAARGHVDVVVRIHDAGLDLGAPDPQGQTAANHAARGRQMEVLEAMIERGVPMPRGVDAWSGAHPDLFSVFQERVNRAAVGVCIRHLQAHGGEWANQAIRLQCPLMAQPFSMSGRGRPVELPGGNPLHPYVVTAEAFARIMRSTARHPLTRRPITDDMLREFKAPGGGYAEGHALSLRALERVCNVYLEGGDAQSLAARGRMAYQELAALPEAPPAPADGHYRNFMDRWRAPSNQGRCCTVS